MYDYLTTFLCKTMLTRDVLSPKALSTFSHFILILHYQILEHCMRCFLIYHHSVCFIKPKWKFLAFARMDGPCTIYISLQKENKDRRSPEFSSNLPLRIFVTSYHPNLSSFQSFKSSFPQQLSQDRYLHIAMWAKPGQQANIFM